MAEAPLPDDPSRSCRCRSRSRTSCARIESDPKLADLVAQLEDCVEFDGRRVLYQWIGGTRSDWRGQGHFRALTEEQEVWAIANGFDEIIVKTKNRFYEMRSTLAQLHFDVIRFVPHPFDDGRVEGVPQEAPRPARARRAPQPPLGHPHGVVAERIDDAGILGCRLLLRPRRGSPVASRARSVPRGGPARRRAADPRPPLCSPLHPGDPTRAQPLWPAALATSAARCTSATRRHRVTHRLRFSSRLPGDRRAPSRGTSRAALRDGRRLLCMEGVANPDNVGGLFRIAEAFGGDCVLLDPVERRPFLPESDPHLGRRGDAAAVPPFRDVARRTEDPGDEGSVSWH